MKHTVFFQRERSVSPAEECSCRAINVQVVLGSPGAGCRGVGVCRIVPEGYRTPIGCPLTGAILGFSPGGKLKIMFDAASLSALQREKHFGWGIFRVETPFDVPLFACRRLGRSSYQIKPGTYPVREQQGFLAVEF
jgi:hypothetical protein